MAQWLEFHDSYLQRASVHAGGAELMLDAFVHQWVHMGGSWVGTGLSRAVRITLGPPATGSNLDEELDIYDCCLTLRGAVIRDLVPLPFFDDGDVSLSFDGRYGGTVAFAERGITVEPIGEGTYIEDLPDDMRPPDAR